MEDLIQEYKTGRKALRDRVKAIQGRIQEIDDPADEMDLAAEKSLVNGMIRDMTEAISLMKNPHHRLRGVKKDASKRELTIVTMDPAQMSLLNIPEREWDPDEEDYLRKRIRETFELHIQRRMDLLTNKQRSTIQRWIYQEKSISQIARDDGVSRQSVWERLFGNRTHQGALKKLKGEGELHESEYPGHREKDGES